MSKSVKYDLKSVKVPRLAGKLLQGIAWIMEHPVLKHLVMGRVITHFPIIISFY